jgi:mannose-6-phosphate isomerase-like protein (cupin superfamily)
MGTAVLDLETRQRLGRIEDEKRQIAVRLKRLIVAETLNLLDFTNKDERGFVEYYPGVFVRDITSIIGRELGLTSLHIMVKDDIIIDPHEHIDQSQTIMVRTGKIQNTADDNHPFYYKGDTFFIRKNVNHSLKYFAGSEYLVTFKPQLNEEE